MQALVVGNPVIDEICRDGRPHARAIGGTATYAALALRALGCNVSVVGDLGASGADAVFPTLTAAAVDTCHLWVRPGVPSTSFMLDYRGEPPVRHGRLLHPGPRIAAERLAQAPRPAEFVHVGPVAGELSPGAIRAVLAWGAPCGIDLHALRVFDAAGAFTHAAARTTEIPFGGFDTVKGSFEEIAAFVGRPLPTDADRTRTVLAAMREMAATGIAHVLATDGAAGALVLAGGRGYAAPAYAVPVEVDATGAGDVFLTSFLLARHARGATVAAATAFATAAASFVVEGTGTSVLGTLAGVAARQADVCVTPL